MAVTGEPRLTAQESEDQMRLVEFASLEPGWDGYNAAPPTPEVVQQACDFLAALQTYKNLSYTFNPTVVGGIGFTLARKSRKVYVEFRNTSNAHALFSDGVTVPRVDRVNLDRAGYLQILAQAESYLHVNLDPARSDEA